LRLNSESNDRYQQLMRNNANHNNNDAMIQQLLGAVPNSLSLQMLTASISCLGGKQILLQTGVHPKEFNDVTLATQDYLCPQPAGLSKYPFYQSMKICCSIFKYLDNILRLFGPEARW